MGQTTLMGCLVDAIRKCGGSDISLCAEGSLLRRYFMPCPVSGCREIAEASFSCMNRMMNDDGIQSISFYDGKSVYEIVRTCGEFCISRASDIKGMRERNPEDYIRIMEIISPGGNSIYG